VSHGCTNVAVNHAEWLFNWADIGTPVVVHY
ncbi:L,D-transpeptidase, partial [Planktothricoides raciborskii]